MKYEQHTIGSRNPLKRWLHRQRFSASLRLLHLKAHQRLLDYGCGDGELSLQVSTHEPEVEITAFDPAEELCEQAKRKLSGRPHVTVTQAFDPRWPPFDRIACLETIEHLPEKELQELLTNIRNMLKEEGCCLFTFPIEHGLISLLKNAYRLVTKRDSHASLKRSLRCLFHLPVQRETPRKLSTCNYIYSHVGFDCERMLATIGDHFSIVKRKVLPTGMVSLGLGNSIAVIACKVEDENNLR